jgi:hypothetical protein
MRRRYIYIERGSQQREQRRKREREKRDRVSWERERQARETGRGALDIGSREEREKGSLHREQRS